VSEFTLGRCRRQSLLPDPPHRMSSRPDDPIRRFTELLAKYRGPEADLLATSHPARPLPTHPKECPPV